MEDLCWEEEDEGVFPPLAQLSSEGRLRPRGWVPIFFFFLFFSVIVNESASSSSSSTRWKKRANLSSVRRRDQSRLSVSRMEREDVEHKIGTVPLDRDIPLFHFVTLLRKGAFLMLFFRATSNRNSRLSCSPRHYLWCQIGKVCTINFSPIGASPV